MLNNNSFVIYKSNLALIIQTSQDKYTIKRQICPSSPTGKPAQYAEQKVREKDVIFLSASQNSSSVANLEKALENAENSAIKDNYKSKIAEIYELLVSDPVTAKEKISLTELAELAEGKIETNFIWAFYCMVKNTFFFKSTEENCLDFVPRTQNEIDELEKKEYEKQNATKLQEEFITRLKQKKINLPDDSAYMQEIEAFVLGKTEKSRFLQQAELSQNAEKAHKLLLETGFWDITKNPYPSRFGLSMNSSKLKLEPPAKEERIHVGCTAYAIDNEDSNDPDDAIGFDGDFIWIHIADPCSTVTAGSKIDIEARNRGTTLYMPEGISRMISDEGIYEYALGLKEKSFALSFKIKLDDKAAIQDVEILKTIVNVKRLTYVQADNMQDSQELKELFKIAKKYREKRLASGAIELDIPRVDVHFDQNKNVQITPELHNTATDMVKEMMLLAGEAASKFAFKNNIPFPYISTEQIELPKTILPGLAGQFQILRCMKSRRVGVNPSMHCILGLSTYCQVTSPLRRYVDLIAHQQLRLFLENKTLITKDELLERISIGDAGIVAANKAGRYSELHFKLVYLIQNPQWTGKAVAINLTGNLMTFYIPSLGIETQITNQDYKLNQEINVKIGSIALHELKVSFLPVSI